MKFLKFPAVLAVASCFFINSIANATVKDESELIDAKLPVKVEKQIAKPEAPAQNKKVVVKKESNIPKQKIASQNKKELPKPKVTPVKKEYFRGMELPANYKAISIFGSSVATKGQAVNLIKAKGIAGGIILVIQNGTLAQQL